MYKVSSKLKRELGRLSGKKFIQRNWELQFNGKENDAHLKKALFENKKMNEIIPLNLTTSFYDKFRSKDEVFYSHSMNMLLVLSKFFS
jgi:hypothetical protein